VADWLEEPRGSRNLSLAILKAQHEGAITLWEDQGFCLIREERNKTFILRLQYREVNKFAKKIKNIHL
jgi:hypothetical protein